MANGIATNIDKAEMLNLGQLFRTFKRVFNFGRAFDAADAGCLYSFNRTFHHVDWVDGESLVQAGKTQDEEGFNERLHAIENDLDALASQVQKLFSCLADMRANLHDRLEEVKSELNNIDSDLFACCGTGIDVAGPAVSGIHNVFTGTPFTTLGDPVPDLAKAQFAGEKLLDGENVLAWQVGKAVLTVPNEANPWQRQGLQKAGRIQQLAQTNSDFQQAFPGTRGLAAAGGPSAVQRPTVAQLVDRFGGTSVGGGMTLKDALSILPLSASFASPAELARVVSEREGAALRASGADAALLAASLGVDLTTESITAAPTAKMLNVSEASKKALAAGGFTTVGKLAAADVDIVARVLARHDIADALAEAVRLHGLASTLINVA